MWFYPCVLFRPGGAFGQSPQTLEQDAVDVQVLPGGRDRHGRQSRVVLIPRRCPTLGSSPGRWFRGDGGYKARYTGERAISRKPSRRECRIVSAYLQWLTRALSTYARAAAGVPNTRHSLRPPISSDNDMTKTRADRAAGMRSLVIARSAATKQSMVPQAVRWIASLRSQW